MPITLPRRWKAALIITLVLAAVVVITPMRVVPLQWAGHALVSVDPLVRADIAIVPVWSGAAGALEVADLMHAGMIDRVGVLGTPMMPEEKEFQRRGVPFEDEAVRLIRQMKSLGVTAVERLPTPVEGTEDEVKELADWCRANPVRQLMIISRTDHSRRLRRILRRTMTQCGATVSVRTSRYGAFDPDRWFESRYGLRIGVVELEKLLLDVLRHPSS